MTACNPRRNGVVKDLLENVPNAEVAKPRLRGSPTTAKSVAADFAYMARAKRLVVTESTFSFWAAFLGTLTEVHAPSAGVLPAPLGEKGSSFSATRRRRTGAFISGGRGAWPIAHLMGGPPTMRPRTVLDCPSLASS